MWIGNSPDRVWCLECSYGIPGTLRSRLLFFFFKVLAEHKTASLSAYQIISPPSKLHYLQAPLFASLVWCLDRAFCRMWYYYTIMVCISCLSFVWYVQEKLVGMAVRPGTLTEFSYVLFFLPISGHLHNSLSFFVRQDDGYEPMWDQHQHQQQQQQQPSIGVSPH